MTPEMAMEQYVTILSENVPGWMDDHVAVSLLLLAIVLPNCRVI